MTWAGAALPIPVAFKVAFGISTDFHPHTGWTYSRPSDDTSRFRAMHSYKRASGSHVQRAEVGSEPAAIGPPNPGFWLSNKGVSVELNCPPS